MKAVSVFPLPNYKLKVSFEDGVCGVINLKAFLQNGIFAVLQDETLFNQVKFNKSAVFWSDELEIDLLNIYLELSGKSFEELFPKSIYA